MPLPPHQLPRLLSLYVPQMRGLHRRLLCFPHYQPLVVIVHSHRKGDFDIALSDDVFVESVEDGAGGGEGLGWRRRGVVIGRRRRRRGIVDGVAAGCTVACDPFLIVHDEVGWTAWYFFVVAVYVLGRVGLIGNMLHDKLRMRNLTTRRPRRQSPLVLAPITALCSGISSSNIRCQLRLGHPVLGMTSRRRRRRIRFLLHHGTRLDQKPSGACSTVKAIILNPIVVVAGG
mmetsp:Transcript_9107/g.19637  ORF Transcript_9107/g.19637 Transcript_9107/m.19637 type:complete len:230 (+) Transcript_9107:1569-2258(+)